jgi:hypothetical protein
MSNERLRSTLRTSGYLVSSLADELEVDPKTIQRWMTRGRTPHRGTALRAAKLLGVPAAWLWPDLEHAEPGGMGGGEVVGFYPHRSQVPKNVWLDMLMGATKSVDILTYAALHLVEDNPQTIELLRRKAADGVRVRVAMGDPDSAEVGLRGREEGIPEGIVGMVRMASTYYAPLIGAPGVEFHLHRTTLYNSIYRYDDQMLVNHHVYGTYGHLAPVLHIRKIDSGDLFGMYTRSLDLIWGQSYAPAG